VVSFALDEIGQKVIIKKFITGLFSLKKKKKKSTVVTNYSAV